MVSTTSRAIPSGIRRPTSGRNSLKKLSVSAFVHKEHIPINSKEKFSWRSDLALSGLENAVSKNSWALPIFSFLLLVRILSLV